MSLRLPPRETGKAIVAWTPAVLCAGWTMFRLFGLDHGFPLVPLATYTPYVFPLAVTVAVLGLALRHWVPAAVAVGSALVLALILAPRIVGGPDDADGRTLRVMSSNVLAGNGDAGQLLELVRERDVEILAVQELTPKFVARFEAAGASEALPFMQLQPTAGVRGSGVWSAYPLRESGSGGEPFQQTGAVVRPPGPEVAVLSAHPRPPTGPAAADGWAAGMERLPEPDSDGPAQLLLGDFNSTFDNSRFRDLIDEGYADAAEQMGEGLGATWPAIDKPFVYLPVTIDHLLYDEDQVGVREFEVLELDGSDHRPLFAELVLRD